MLKDFKNFVMRGNVLDLAVAVIIGGAFGGVITSLVNDVMMPPIGMLLGKVDFTNLFIDLTGVGYKTLAEATEAGAAVIKYGMFLNTVINFLIVALVVFLVVRAAKSLPKKAEAPAAPAEPATKVCPYCATDIPVKATRCPYCTSQL